MAYRTKFDTSWVDTSRDIWIMETGTWRHQRPVLNANECHECGWCYLYCPAGCIKLGKESISIDLQYCKGCGICARECPAEAITMEREEIA